MKFRKKPVEIEATHYDGDLASANLVIAWIRENGGTARFWGDDTGLGKLRVDTLEGTMTASPGDWIIKGVQGEFYPCKPDIFVKTYEPVEEAE